MMFDWSKIIGIILLFYDTMDDPFLYIWQVDICYTISDSLAMTTAEYHSNPQRIHWILNTITLMLIYSYIK